MRRKKNFQYLEFCLNYNWTRESVLQFLEDLFPNCFIHSDELADVIMKSVYDRYTTITRDIMKGNIEDLMLRGKLHLHTKEYVKRLEEANEYYRTHEFKW